MAASTVSPRARASTQISSTAAEHSSELNDLAWGVDDSGSGRGLDQAVVDNDAMKATSKKDAYNATNPDVSGSEAGAEHIEGGDFLNKDAIDSLP